MAYRTDMLCFVVIHITKKGVKCSKLYAENYVLVEISTIRSEEKRLIIPPSS